MLAIRHRSTMMLLKKLCCAWIWISSISITFKISLLEYQFHIHHTPNLVVASDIQRPDYIDEDESSSYLNVKKNFDRSSRLEKNAKESHYYNDYHRFRSNYYGRRRMQQNITQQNLPQKGETRDSGCSLYVNDFLSSIFSTNVGNDGTNGSPGRDGGNNGESNDKTIIASILPIPGPCKDGPDGEVEEVFYTDIFIPPDLPPLTELIPSEYNPSKSNFPIVFSIALREPLKLTFDQISHGVTIAATKELNSAFQRNDQSSVTFFHEDINGKVLPPPARNKNGGKRYLTGGRRNQQLLEWKMDHTSTKMEDIIIIPPPPGPYVWHRIIINYKIYTPEYYVQEMEPYFLSEVTKAVIRVLEDLVLSNALIKSFWEHELEVYEIAMVGNEDDSILFESKEDIEKVAGKIDDSLLRQINISSSIHGTITFPSQLNPVPWDFRQIFGLIMFVIISSWVIILFLVSSTRKKLRREEQWQGVKLTEHDLRDFLRYGYHVERGGEMIIDDHGSRLGDNDNNSMLIGGTEQNFNTQIITSDQILAHHAQDNNISGDRNNRLRCNENSTDNVEKMSSDFSNEEDYGIDTSSSGDYYDEDDDIDTSSIGILL